MAGQRITFGWNLDGQRATPPRDVVGELVVGPLGLLNILETQLGLLARHPSHAERIVQYRDCLQLLNSDQRFYHQSYATDPLGTAATLLDWRDQWGLYGWDGTLPEQAPNRLHDMAALEQLARTAVSPHVGQRLTAILNALQKRTPDIDQVTCIEGLDTLPERWQAVLAHLPVVVAVDAIPPAGRGFLLVLQQQLQAIAVGQAPSKLPWQDDGSVVVVQAETPLLAAHWLSTQLANESQTLLVCGDDGARLDAQLAAVNRPRQGLNQTSTFRPALQVLPLALELLWDPLNFSALLQFLTHPVCPIRRVARDRLAQKIADAPGIRGEAWQAVLTAIDAYYGEEQAAAVRAQIARWIEHPRFSAELGAPLDAVIARVELVADFFRQRFGDNETSERFAYQAGYAQSIACLASLQTLQRQGATQIRPRQLQKLIAQATANGADNPLWPAEVGAGQIVSQPGAVIEPTERVIWWPLTMPVLPSCDPWSSSEIAALRQAGVHLPAVSDRLDKAARDWVRPVMAARSQLILVLPAPGEEVHPLWQLIEAMVEAPSVLPLEALLSKGGPALTAVTARPLPALKRWWQLPNGVTVAPRAEESFSSLELLLFNPYHWLLRYAAKLQPSRLLGLDDNFRLLGNLAHGLVERYFLLPNALTQTEAEFDDWFANAFDTLVDEEGASLRTPGQGTDLEGFRDRLQQSMRTLRQQVTRAEMVEVLSEQPLAGHFSGGALVGSADLVMRNQRGEQAIVDMKWSGSRKFPDKLKANRHLQLAIYAELLRQHSGRWPSVAYYVLDQARIFAPDDRAFPDAEVVLSSSGESTPQLWQRFVATWQWRLEQQQAGLFEVALASIETTLLSEPPDTAMTMETLNEAYNDYRALAGWERHA